MSDSHAPTVHTEVDPGIDKAGRAGLLAALIMLAVQLIWRLNWSQDGVVQAFPEFIAAALARLTPLAVFGSATENYGSLAKKTLLAAVLIGIVAVGYRAGDLAGSLSKRIGRGGTGRLAAGLLVAVMLWLVTMLLILPIAHLGAFANRSSYTNDILTQLTVTFVVFWVLWAIFSSPAKQDTAIEPGSDTVSRRTAMSQGAWALGTLIATFTVGISAWRLISPRKVNGNPMTTTTGTAVKSSADDIVATQRAIQGHPLPTPTPTEESAQPASESASLQSDATKARRKIRSTSSRSSIPRD